jgi:hypothetical protein
MRITVVFLMSILLLPFVSEAQNSCEGSANYSLLDFWVGDWKVFEGKNLVGTNRIEKILKGCAVLEHWTDSLGNEGKSLFYFDLVTQNWKQVWVTDSRGMKEKVLRKINKDGSVLFQGEVLHPDGKKVLDRTTLFPQKNDVRQVIEQSTDGGKSWQTTFDAIYKKN